MTHQSIATAIREAIEGRHPSSRDWSQNTITMSVELATEIADTLDALTSGGPPRRPEPVHTRPMARRETKTS